NPICWSRTAVYRKLTRVRWLTDRRHGVEQPTAPSTGVRKASNRGLRDLDPTPVVRIVTGRAMTPEQSRIVARHSGARRKAHNWALGRIRTDIEAYRTDGAGSAPPSRYGLRKA